MLYFWRKKILLKLEKIHEDNRGDIYLLKGDLKEHEEISILTTKKGVARGGCIHRINDEYNVVLEGEIIYYVGEQEFHMKKGDTVKVPKNTPHYFLSLLDSIVAEWGATTEEKKDKYAPLRKIVEKINKNDFPIIKSTIHQTKH